MSAAPRSGDPLAVLRRRLSLPALGVPVPERHAAVLVALSGPSDALDVTLTRRAEHMNSHAGEVALPGGKHEPGDADLDVTALRESAEEIGLPASAVELLGRLEPLETINGLTVVPFVGFVPDAAGAVGERRRDRLRLPGAAALFVRPGQPAVR